MTFDKWFAKEYGDKREQLGLVVPELMRAAYEAAERQALERAIRVTADAKTTSHACDAIRALLIEQSASKEKQ